MIIAARVFAALALLAATLIYSIMHLEFPEVGFKGMTALAGLTAWICILSGLTALVLSFLKYRRRRDKRHYWPDWVSSVGFTLMLGGCSFHGRPGGEAYVFMPLQLSKAVQLCGHDRWFSCVLNNRYAHRYSRRAAPRRRIARHDRARLWLSDRPIWR